MSLACIVYLGAYMELLLAVAAGPILHMTFMYRRIATQQRRCWGLVLKCYKLRTRQHKMLKVKALHPSKHYFP
jgi:hypothetical protein